MNKEFNKLEQEMLKLNFVQEVVNKFGLEVFKSVFARAWQKGHEFGEPQVKNELRDLVDVLNLVK